ncbi:hypothetical protein C173_03229 [Paenibacillus sp. FSL R7-277]|uniref:DUF5677 domain-containing protein n=1 Tax=Paenibacillus sp. FSL R7-277 TaxID=1227352 RepID=UPI0003E2A286|nr:DUF5677 domain-containing protein [Paenibacillus sp. FSL R7-277]ETT77495.1 hypothetical protein C173_03229 [Paenibacillus sp. FSL R7-277]
MRKLIQLDNVWEKELDELSNTHKDNLANFRKLISVLHTSEVLIDTFNKKKINPYDLDQLQFIISYYFTHTYHQSLAIYHLSKLGLGSSGLILVRAVMESLVNMSYLWQVKKINGNDEERLAWIEYVNVSRHKMDQAWKNMQSHRRKNSRALAVPAEIFTNENSFSFEEKAKDFKNKYQRTDWSKLKNVEMRARAVDDLQISILPGMDLEEMYNTVYRWSSEYVHGLSSSSEMYMTGTEKELLVHFGVSNKNIDIVLPLLTRVMTFVVVIVNHIFNLDVNISEQIITAGFNNDKKENKNE